ncbi:MAG: pectinesterase family protein [Opitutaceae bacterium]|jgi:pectinesterase
MRIAQSPLPAQLRWTAAALALGTLAAVRAGPLDPPAGFSAVVAADGSGQFTSVQAAINAAPQLSPPSPLWIIRVKPGLYRERVYVQREKRLVRLVGDDPGSTEIAFDLYANVPGPDGKPIGTFLTPTVWIDADDFGIENMTIANTAGPKGQALALRVDGDRVVFKNCRFLGWQDTILGNRGRHCFEGCTIAGAIDFIFGAATEFYQSCRIRCLGDGYITAASTPAGEPYGFVFANCEITGDNPSVRTYLGRPWRDFASVTFLDTRMTQVVRPSGWHNWDRPAREKTARYAEFGSTGEGADPSARAPWSRSLSAAEAAAITPERVLAGPDGWKP